MELDFFFLKKSDGLFETTFNNKKKKQSIRKTLRSAGLVVILQWC